MKRNVPARLRGARLLRRAHLRFLLVAAVAIVAVGLGAGFALARTRTAAIGTGVVVINTNLAYDDGEAAGTGMVLTSSGEILTNNHVIDGATTINIVLPGTGDSYTAKVVGYDVSADVAVLQAVGASNLKTVSIGNSSTLKVGEAVKATGNAEGAGALTTTTGEITALAQSITVSDDQGGTESLADLIEMNALLEPGDSGGPLVDAAGQAIGMDTAGSTGEGPYQETANADGYAIPINVATAIAAKIEAGKASATIHVGATAFLGVEAGSSGYDVSGAVIDSVLSGGAAARAGLVSGDIITALDGHAVSSATSLGTVLVSEKAGAHVSLTYLDASGVSHTTTVTLATGPPQ